MNIYPVSSEDHVSKLICSVNQPECNADWILASGPESGVISLSVFGSEGNRYSILVIEKEHLRTDYAGKDGKWILSEARDEEDPVRFNLEWAAPAAGSGCMVLCGRETPIHFHSSA